MEDHRLVLPRQYHHLLTRFEAEGTPVVIGLEQASRLLVAPAAFQQLQLVRSQARILALGLVDNAGAAARDG